MRGPSPPDPASCSCPRLCTGIRIARSAVGAAVVAACAICPDAGAFAQGAGFTAPLSGLVTDASGRVVTGAAVTVRDNSTAATSEAVTDSVGRFAVPALNPGTCTVTVSLSGFKTAVLPDVPITAGTPASVRVVLDAGVGDARVVLSGRTSVVQTVSAAVQSAMTVEQVQNLPVTSRTALDLVTSVPGVQTPDASRNAVISGLPGGSINVTLDGINVQDNINRGLSAGSSYYGGDGFFTIVQPTIDSVEGVTVTSSAPGFEATGQGATQVRVVTRAGSNRFTGSVYNTWRNQAGVADDDVAARNRKRGWPWRLNTPYWFNKRDLPRTPAGEYFIDDARLQTPGFRVGGPILRDRLFYFLNGEWFLWPNQVARTRYLLNANARQGDFAYPAADGSGTRRVNLLALAASQGHTATGDPTITTLLADIRSAAAGVTAGNSIDSWDLNLDRFLDNPESRQQRVLPALRLDYNATRSHRLTASARYNRSWSAPDVLSGAEPRFPAFANHGGHFSDTYQGQVTLRSTLGRASVNEARLGFSGANARSFPEVSASQFDCATLGCQGAGGQGWDLDIGMSVGANPLTTATSTASPRDDRSTTLVCEDTLTWLKGRHSVSVGVSFLQVAAVQSNMPGGVVRTVTFGVSAADPAYAMLTPSSGNFPGGISDTYAGYARNLYALLTGRVTQVSGTAVLGGDGLYALSGERIREARQEQLGVFAGDAWRLRPNLTLTGGLRWELQFPLKPGNSAYAKLEQWTDVYGVGGAESPFEPGTMTGRAPVVVGYPAGEPAYRMDWNNLAPSVGVAWRPSLAAGWLSRIAGAEPVVRGGYSLAYTRNGLGELNLLSNNPGPIRNVARSLTSGTPTLGDDGLPVLLRDTARLAASAYPAAPAYPLAPAVSESVAAVDPELQTPSVHQYSVGWQRELGRSAALEVRYVGNTSRGRWTVYDLNSFGNRHLIENGFLAEFQRAQRNLQANIAAGLGHTFAFTGVPGTYPLPIYLAHFAGVPLADARNQDPASYASSNFRREAWYRQLALHNPNIIAASSPDTNGLQNPAFAANAQEAGLPANFWVANPDVAQGGAYLLENGGPTRYDALQVELRRRMTRGLLVQANYEFGRALTSQRPTLRPGYTVKGATSSGEYVTNLTAWSVAHALKFTWVVELPFGRGKTWGGDAGRWLDALIGGWEWDGVGRIQSGRLVDFGNYRLVGMTEEDLRKMFKVYQRPDGDGKPRIYMLPQDVIDNSIIAVYSASATSPTGYAGAVPTGRYFARAGGPDCVQAYSGQCAPLSHLVRGPRFNRIDMAMVKRISVAGTMRIELRVELLNVFDAVNLVPRAEVASAPGGWEVVAAARDASAQNPGGRITQFEARVSW